MRKIITGLLLTAFLGGASAWADDPSLDQNDQQAGTAESLDTSADSSRTSDTVIVVPRESHRSDQQAGEQAGEQAGAADDRYSGTDMSSQASTRDVDVGYANNALVSAQPQAGVMTFTDAAGATTARGAVGLTLDMNAMRLFGQDAGRVFIGPQTGALFSHVGSPSSGFFGNGDSSTGISNDANLLLVPANLKIGYAILPNLRIAAHGGGNVIYRSVGNSLSLGNSSTDASADSGWTLYPNVGGDVELGLGKSAAILLRPDLTIAPNNNLFTGTIGLALGLG